LLRTRYTVRALATLLRNCADEIRSIRSAQDTGGHAAELVPPCARRGAHYSRRHAGDIAEGAAEATQASPARYERNLGNRQSGIAQECRGPLYAPGQEVSVGGNAEDALEGSCEVRGGDAADARKPRDRPVLL
jgi:hypothetical protein